MAMILPHWQVHEGQGPHLLLVHGFLSSRAQWMLNIEALGKVCTPVTVELFGHANSPSPADPACYEPGYYVACFEAIRTALGVERWFLLGYSLGAGLTLRYAFEHPQRVTGHLFTNSTSGLADAAQRQAWRAGSKEAAAGIRSGGHSAMVRIPVHPRHARSLPEAVQGALLADAKLHNPLGIAMTLEVTNPAVSMRERLAENTRPACLIWGTKERRFTPHAEHARSAMADLRIVELDAGHGMNMEAPAAFNLAVAEFIDQCRTSSTH
ncbi:MAG: alpha/beta hydrolase [Pseudomonadales bacterium]|nr:alpha/beta fold hydrolase [Pseudomonadales bacterium]